RSCCALHAHLPPLTTSGIWPLPVGAECSAAKMVALPLANPSSLTTKQFHCIVRWRCSGTEPMMTSLDPARPVSTQPNRRARSSFLGLLEAVASPTRESTLDFGKLQPT
ncbi:hypothetical protein M440DRAFT_1311685, partial [Trichoderma longibrachiatum ATCC 18648]